MKEDVIGLVLTGVLLVLFIAGTIIAIQPYQSWVCDNTWQETPHRYVWFAGCQVETPEGWVPAANYRVFDR
jgi:hypothetical protein